MSMHAIVALSLAVAFALLISGCAYSLFVKPFETERAKTQPGRSANRGWMLGKLSSWMRQWYPGGDAALQRQLDQAGMTVAPLSWRLQCLGVVALFFSGGFGVPLFAGAPAWSVVGAACGLVLGWGFTKLWMVGRRRSFQSELERSLPDTLELMCVLVRTGLPLERVLREVGDRPEGVGAMAPQLKRVMVEVDAGATLPEALENLSQRCGSEQVSALAASLSLSQQQGISVSRVLEVQAQEARKAWFESVRQQVGRAEVLVQLPLCLCFVPAVLVMTMAPMVSTLLPQVVGIMGM